MRGRIITVITALTMTAFVFGVVPAAGDGPAFAGSKAPAKVTGLTIRVNAQPTAALQWKETPEAQEGIYHVPEGVTKIATYIILELK